jgi:hypothetical protein
LWDDLIFPHHQKFGAASELRVPAKTDSPFRNFALRIEMKTTSVLLASLVAAFALTACGKKEEAAAPAPAAKPAAAAPAESAMPAADAASAAAAAAAASK